MQASLTITLILIATSYAIKKRKTQKSDIQVIPNEDPPKPPVYAVVNKQRKGVSMLWNG